MVTEKKSSMCRTRSLSEIQTQRNWPESSSFDTLIVNSVTADSVTADSVTMGCALPDEIGQPYAVKDSSGEVMFIKNIIRPGPDEFYQYVGATGLVEVTVIDDGVLQ